MKRLSSVQASLLIVHTTVIVNVHFTVLDIAVSTVSAPVTSPDNLSSVVDTAPVSNHDVDDQNRDEVARTRRRQSLVVPHEHPGPPELSCEGANRHHGLAWDGSQLRRRPGAADLARPGCIMSVRGR